MTCTDGGYDYCFIDAPPDIVICKICHFASRDPYLSECCGHVFCKSCVERVKTRSVNIADVCPMCRNEDFNVFVNKQLDRITKGLRVYCTNKDKGCEWQGELNDIGAHLDDCPFESVSCVNKCGKILQRQYIVDHTENKCPCRTVSCQYCHIENEWQFIEGKHKDQCRKFPLACPNHCEVSNVSREDLVEHFKVCPLESIHCEYYYIGCTEMMSRKNQAQHNKDYLHEHLILSTCELAKVKDMANVKQTIETSIVETKDEFTSLKQDVSQLKGEFMLQLKHMEKHLTTLTKLANTQRETIGKLTEKLDTLSRTVDRLKPSSGFTDGLTDSSEDEDLVEPVRIIKADRLKCSVKPGVKPVTTHVYKKKW